MADLVILGGPADPITPADPIVTIQISRETALKIIDDIMANFPEASMTLRVVKWNYEERKFTVEDTEENFPDPELGDCPKTYMITETDLLKGFKLMFEPGMWPAGLDYPPACAYYDKKDPKNPWDRWLCNADAIYHDAFLQLAVLGEVIYG